jgi:hypothetical protein
VSDKLQWGLERCLVDIDRGEPLEACLANTGAAAAELRPLLETALAVRQLSVPPERDGGREAGRRRLHSILGAANQRSAEARPRRFAYPLGAALALTVIGLFLGVGFGAGLVRFGKSPAEPRISGIASSVHEQSLEVQTAEGPVTVGLDESTQVRSASTGLVRSPQQIRPGSSIEIALEARGNSLTALQIEVLEESEPNIENAIPDYDVDFTGTVTQVGATSVSVRASFGDATVNLTPSSRVSGPLAPGTVVEVHGSPLADGSYSAEAITVLPDSTISPQPQ